MSRPQRPKSRENNKRTMPQPEFRAQHQRDPAVYHRPGSSIRWEEEDDHDGS